MAVFVLATALALLVALVGAQDPAGGWMAYAVGNLPSTAKRITRLEMTWTVGAAPNSNSAFYSPWFGMDPADNLNLLQPVNPWGGSSWSMYTEYFQWSPEDNSNSKDYTVQSGDTLHGSITYDEQNDAYTIKQTVVETGAVSSQVVKCQSGKKFTVPYVVYEKVWSCGSYPPDGKVTFHDIIVECDGQDCTKEVQWEAKVKDSNCNMQAHIDSSKNEISITWDTAMQSMYDNYTLDQLVALNSHGWAKAMLKHPVGPVGQSKELVRVPGGHMIERGCIVEVPNGDVFNADKYEMAADCLKAPIAAPQVQIYAADVHMKSTEPLTSFVADWTAPQLPERYGGQVVYFWPGFKARQPEMGLPVLQPVLQYGERENAWKLQSWFVDGNDRSYPVVTAPAIIVKPGDKITSYMRQSADGKTWTVSGTNVNTGQNSTLNIAYSKAGNTDYDYAMLVNENVGVNTHCDLMPKTWSGNGVVTFTNVRVNDKVPQWTTRANCAGNRACDCGNTADVASNGDVTLGWRTGVDKNPISI